MDSPRPREDTIPLHVAATTTATSAWIEVCGEVDVSNREQLYFELAGIDLADADVVHIDLRHLTFCDTRGCAMLVRFERAARETGHQVHYLNARPTVRKVLCLLTPGDGPTFV